MIYSKSFLVKTQNTEDRYDLLKNFACTTQNTKDRYDLLTNFACNKTKY